MDQTYNLYEHLIIDAKSTDKTLSIIKAYPKCKIISEFDNGIYDAMNKGIKIARGEIIGFLNSDDFFANNDVLSKINSLFEQRFSLDACYADLIYVDRLNVNKNIRY